MSESSDDLSAVAWVNEELRRSLDAAHKALRRFGKEVETVDGSDIDAVRFLLECTKWKDEVERPSIQGSRDHVV